MSQSIPAAGAVAADNSLSSRSRLEALRDTGLMDSTQEGDFDRLARLASTFLQVPVALVSLVDNKRQFFKSAVGLPPPWDEARQTPLSHSFCQHVVTGAALLIIEDARSHPLVRDNLAVSDLGVIAYAGMPLQLTSGLVLGSFCLIDVKPRRWQQSDLTALKDLAASVTTEIELRLMLAAQQDIMAIVSHDLKNPLGSIGMNCEVLEAGLARPDAGQPPLFARSVGRIRRSCDRMHEMVHQLLDQARHNRGQLVLRTRLNSARSVAQRAVDSVQSLAEEKNVTLLLGEDLHSVKITCDAARTSQVLTNLLSNAIAYTAERSTVSIDAVQGDGWVRITVQDQGPGLSLAAQAKVFEPFWQAAEAAQKEGGHGYGLHAASKLAEAQGARLGVNSEEGQGATFFLEMPTLS